MKILVCFVALILLGGSTAIAAGKSFESNKLLEKNFSDLPLGLQQNINENVSAKSIVRGKIKFPNGLELSSMSGFNISTNVTEKVVYGIVEFSYVNSTVLNWLDSHNVSCPIPITSYSRYCIMPKSELNDLKSSDFVSSAGKIPIQSKISKEFFKNTTTSQDKSLEITIGVLGNISDSGVPSEFTTIGVGATQIISTSAFSKYLANATIPQIRKLLNLDFVMYIGAPPKYVPANINGLPGIGVDVINAVDPQYDGSGVTVAVIDSGIAFDGTNYHPDLPAEAIHDAYNFCYDEPDVYDRTGHGTHIAGILAGMGNRNALYKGVASGTKLNVYKNAACNNPHNIFDVFTRAAQQNSQILSNSWSTGICGVPIPGFNVSCNGFYGGWREDASNLDYAVLGGYKTWDGTPQYMSVFVAAGNENDQVISPGTCKNCVTVGAAETGNDGNFTHAYVEGDCVEYGSEPATSPVCFSNYGPTIDRDIKPDVIAPGVNIISTDAWYIKNYSNVGDLYYHKGSGTSQATPYVSGLAALMMQKYPSFADNPELVKGMIISSAVKLPGVSTAKQGFGHVNGYNSLYNQDGVVETIFVSGTLDTITRSNAYAFSIPAGFKEVKATLVYSDDPVANIIQDLNLYVFTFGGLLGESTSNRDTVEQVTVTSPLSGPLFVYVDAPAILRTVRYAVVVQIRMADPSLSLSVETSAEIVLNNSEFTLMTILSNAGYTTVGSYVEMKPPEGVTMTGVKVYRNDGVNFTLPVSQLYKTDDNYYRLSLGETVKDHPRKAEWVLKTSADIVAGTHTVGVRYGAMNFAAKSLSKSITVFVPGVSTFQWVQGGDFSESMAFYNEMELWKCGPDSVTKCEPIVDNGRLRLMTHGSTGGCYRRIEFVNSSSIPVYLVDTIDGAYNATLSYDLFIDHRWGGGAVPYIAILRIDENNTVKTLFSSNGTGHVEKNFTVPVGTVYLQIKVGSSFPYCQSTLLYAYWDNISLTTAALPSETPLTGNLSGTVIDDYTKDGLDNVQMKLLKEGELYSTTSTSGGQYSFKDVPAGSVYTIEMVPLNGYSTYGVTSMTLMGAPSKERIFDFTLFNVSRYAGPLPYAWPDEWVRGGDFSESMTFYIENDMWKCGPDSVTKCEPIVDNGRLRLMTHGATGGIYSGGSYRRIEFVNSSAIPIYTLDKTDSRYNVTLGYDLSLDHRWGGGATPYIAVMGIDENNTVKELFYSDDTGRVVKNFTVPVGTVYLQIKVGSSFPYIQSTLLYAYWDNISLTTAALPSESPLSGNLSGKVIDEYTKEGLDGVQTKLFREGLLYDIMSTSNGAYSFKDLPAGYVYKIEMTPLSGYSTHGATSVTLMGAPSKERTFDFTLFNVSRYAGSLAYAWPDEWVRGGDFSEDMDFYVNNDMWRCSPDARHCSPKIVDGQLRLYKYAGQITCGRDAVNSSLIPVYVLDKTNEEYTATLGYDMHILESSSGGWIPSEAYKGTEYSSRITVMGIDENNTVKNLFYSDDIGHVEKNFTVSGGVVYLQLHLRSVWICRGYHLTYWDNISLKSAVTDSDGDGVSDDADFCANTPTGYSVDANGCSYGASQEVIASEGGTVKNDASTVELAVPANALSSDTTITVQNDTTTPDFAVGNGRIIGYRYDFGPEGTTFSTAATITIHYDESVVGNENHLRIYWYDDSAGKWKALSTVQDKVNNVLYANITHFTTFSAVELYDSDGDGVLNINDNCPQVANADQLDTDSDGAGDVCDADDDNDGVEDTNDNCPLVVNTDQLNTDSDEFGNACDADDDNDTVNDTADNCPLIVNADQLDTDSDSLGNACDADDDNDSVNDTIDNCPLVANADQADNEGDGVGDVCDTDDDNDTVLDVSDNCPLIVNTNQTDMDSDSLGDACDPDIDGDNILNADDACAYEDATGFDADSDGCIDTFSGLADIINTLPDDVLSNQTKNSLVSKVENALKSTDKNKTDTAVNQLNAFINEVEAQRGKKISEDAADMLVGYVENLIAKLQEG